jgi:hypothetical protein
LDESTDAAPKDMRGQLYILFNSTYFSQSFVTALSANVSSLSQRDALKNAEKTKSG